MEEVFIKLEQRYCEGFSSENVEEEAVNRVESVAVEDGNNQIFIKQEQESSNVYTSPILASQYFNLIQEVEGYGIEEAATNEKDQYRYECKYCFKRFRFHCRWKRHTASHEKPKKSRVPIIDLRSLLVEEHAPRERRSVESNDSNSDENGKKRRKDLMCNLCGKYFTQKNNLHRHKLVHLGTKPFQCDECGLRFTEKSALDRHQVVHVGGGDIFKCTQCKKVFNRKSNLERHCLIHSGGRKHPCLTCGKTFMQRAHLRRHEQTHTGTKDLECEECGKRFNRRGNLNIHVLLHKGIKLFQCEICGRKFSQKVNLRMHLKMQHNRQEGDT